MRHANKKFRLHGRVNSRLGVNPNTQRAAYIPSEM